MAMQGVPQGRPSDAKTLDWKARGKVLPGNRAVINSAKANDKEERLPKRE